MKTFFDLRAFVGIVGIVIFCVTLVSHTNLFPRINVPSVFFWQQSSQSSIYQRTLSQSTSSSASSGITITMHGDPWLYPKTVNADDHFAITYFETKEILSVTGTTLPDTATMVVTFTPAFGDKRDSDRYTLKNYNPGDRVWKYSIGTKLGNINEGYNEYVIQALDAKDKVLDQKTLILQKSPDQLSRTFSSPKQIPLEITWRDPIEHPILGIYASTDDVDRYIHYVKIADAFESMASSTLGFDILTSKIPPYSDDEKNDLEKEKVYEVGDVSTGTYAGAKVFAHRFVDYGVLRSTNHVEHFLQKSDGSLLQPTQFGSIFTAKMPVDKEAMIDAHAPASIPVANSRYALQACSLYTCGKIHMFNAQQDTQSPFFSSGKYSVFNGENGCFNVMRKDGFVEEYLINLPQDGEIPITWNDGTTTSFHYLSLSGGGCGYSPGCHLIADVSQDSLELVGKTASGLDVFQEKLTPAMLFDEKSSRNMQYESGIISLSDLYQSLPRYDGENIPKPEEFIAEHPAIYIKDPFGRFIFYRKESYQPPVECGKPVIYLYPKREQDIHVKVEPTGGITVSDPKYGDGWNVRATPQSDIYNYADGKTYPYLFWEGYGKDYERPTRGFVIARTDVSRFLQEKLLMLGLTEKESADFKEFWEPKLMQSPYVFVTFVDQTTFDSIAPLTVAPKPDTVIRIFMDYMPLITPISVEPLPIKTPVRHGFTVIEWGGALHNTDSTCQTGVFLQ